MHKKFKIPLDKPNQEFLDHLNIEGNNRILFSGRFGIGKTTFIKDFFLNNPDYEAFYLLPVNYQATQNEDIFELIKYDILFNIIEKEFVTKEGSIGDLLISQFYIFNQSSDNLGDFLSLIPKIGKPLALLNKIIEFFGGYEKYKKQVSKDNLERIDDFYKGIEKIKGSVKENDVVTQIIYNTLKSHNDKKNVLIIDDLDRIDPDHIFRILNILSSHYDDSGLSVEDNKFGFEKVILICDIQNVRKIFYSKYGQDVDFSGYIDRFYSKKCFHFSNDDEILNKLDAIINEFVKNTNVWLSEIFKRWIKCIIIDFIIAQSINLRDIKNLYELKNPWLTLREYNKSRGSSINDSDFFMIKFIYALREIFGNDDHKISRCFDSCNSISKGLSKWKYIDLLKELLPFYDINKLDFKNLKNIIITIKEIDLSIEFELEASFNSSGWNYYTVNIKKIVKNEIEKSTIDSSDFYFLLKRIYFNIINLK
jgi:hypothetical protein